MCLTEDLPEMADNWAETLREIASKDDPNLPYVLACLQALAKWYMAQCNIPQARTVLELAKRSTENKAIVDALVAQLEEASFLQGEFNEVLGSMTTEQEN